MFDHTVIISEDDPHLSTYQQIPSIDLRIVKSVGAEKFAELVYDFITEHFLSKKDTYRVRLKSVKCMENNKN